MPLSWNRSTRRVERSFSALFFALLLFLTILWVAPAPVAIAAPVFTPPKIVAAPPRTAPAPPKTTSTQSAGELVALRWSASREKIRAVADCSDGTNPEFKTISGSRFSLSSFASAPANIKGVPSPYENVKVELVKGANGSVSLFFSATGVKVQKMVLDNPRRIVLDFIFTSPTVVREARPAPPPVPPPVTAVRPDGNQQRRAGRFLVVLDPGHGGNDSGATANGLKEKDINLAVGLKMERALKAKGIDVIMTRNRDVYLRLNERTEVANKANADMFVSIHVNALPQGTNSAGFEIFLMALPTDKDALELAKLENRDYLEDRNGRAATDRKTELLLKILGDMQQNNKISESTAAAEVLFKAGNNQGLPMKRVAQAPFFVLRGAGMPAVLLEMGFITNVKESKLLGHPGYQQRIADAMAVGIYNYLKH